GGPRAGQAGAWVDHSQQDLREGELELRADRRRALEDVLHERLRGVGGLTQDGPADADDREDERDEGDQHVERDRARHEEDAVVAGLLDDAAGELRRGGEGGKDARRSRAWAGGGRGRWRVDALRRGRAVRR